MLLFLVVWWTGAVQSQNLKSLVRGIADELSIVQELLGYIDSSVLPCGTVWPRLVTKVCNSMSLAGIMIRNTKAMALGIRWGFAKYVVRTALVILHSSIEFFQLAAALSVFLQWVRQT